DAAGGGAGDQSQADAATDAPDGHCGAGAEAAHDEARTGAQDLPVSPAEHGDRSADQVWAADITYVPIGRGFLYLMAVIDWASRAVLAWRLSNTMDVSFCVSALEEALARFGRPDIFNTDQGSQFTSAAFPGTLAAAGGRISMDGRARWIATLTKRRLKRGVFRSLADFQAAINRFLDEHNTQPTPFRWTADPTTIIAAVKRGHQVLDSIH